MISPILGLALHHVGSRPLRTLLTILGVGIGISAAVAMSVANGAVFRSFEQTVSRVVGNVSLVVAAVEGRLDEEAVTVIRDHPGVLSANPVITLSGQVVEAKESRGITIQAVDILEWFNTNSLSFPQQDSRDFQLENLINPDILFLPQEAAERLKVKMGDGLTIRVRGRQFQLRVGGIFQTHHPGSSWDSLAIMDIAAAQTIFDLVGFVDKFEVTTRPHISIQAVLTDLQKALGPSISVGRPAQRNQQVERMLRSFQLNLSTLSMVGLFVGVFLVYNAVGFSVVQYRREIGILRALGLFRWQISALFLGEAVVMGMVGGAVGTVLGMVAAKFLVVLESETVSELYAPVDMGVVAFTPSLFFIGCLLGVGLSLLGALVPCWEASHTAPARALAPGQYEDARQNRYGVFSIFAAMFFFLAFTLSLLGPINGIPVYGYASAFCLLVAFTCFAPLALHLLGGMLRFPARPSFNVAAHLAVDQILRSPGRNSMTLSALMVGIAIMVGVGVMIQSFRATVESWIDQTMMADVIVTPQLDVLEASQAKREAAFPEDIQLAAAQVPGVSAVDPYRQVRIQVGESTVLLVSRDFRLHAERSQYLFVDQDSDEALYKALNQRGVIVSEVLARRLGVEAGDVLPLPTSRGLRDFPVVGIFYDYATDGGKVVMDRGLYQEYWGDTFASVLAVYRDPMITADELRTRLHAVLAPRMPIAIMSNRELREDILEIFDRTFRVTHGLEFIAVCVGLLGIANTLLTTIVERQREFATFRAIGAGVRQVRAMVLWESLILGVIGAVLGLFAGLWLATLLIFVINKQSFGWTIQFVVSPATLLGAMGVAGLAALLAAYLPARWVTKGVIAEGLRYE